SDVAATAAAAKPTPRADMRYIETVLPTRSVGIDCVGSSCVGSSSVSSASARECNAVVLARRGNQLPQIHEKNQGERLPATSVCGGLTEIHLDPRLGTSQVRRPCDGSHAVRE